MGTKLPVLLAAAATLAGCGVGDTTTAAAVAAKTRAAELEQARATQQRVVSEIDKAAQQTEQRLKEAEGR